MSQIYIILITQNALVHYVRVAWCHGWSIWLAIG